jgi:hypothetical protein
MNCNNCRHEQGTHECIEAFDCDCAPALAFHDEATALLDFIESDFGQSGRGIRLEAIRVELEKAYNQAIKYMDDNVEMENF